MTILSKYSMCKDSSAEETIDVIKKLLNQCSIDLNEKALTRKENPVASVRLTIKGTNIGTNGKGMTLQNAVASGYAEFVERLQNQILDFSFVDDTYTTKNADEFLKNSIVTKSDLKNPNNYPTVQKIIDEGKRYNDKAPKIAIQKFFSVRTKQEVELPVDFIRFLQGSNGMAAGNTFEEAVVQGLSEICERYATAVILTEHKNLPEIPPKYYEQYKDIKALMQYIEDNGYKITVKDASTEKFPVIMTIFEDLKYKENGCMIKSGSHPYFPIALERTLTEFLQGFDIENEKERQYQKQFKFSDNDDIETIIQDLDNQITPANKTNPVFANLFSDKFDYEFNPNIWYFEEVTNKEMLKTLCKKILNYKDDIYIHNSDFLGFPCVYIYIPKMSQMFPISDNNLDELLNVVKIHNNFKEKDYTALTVDKIFKACAFNLKNKHSLEANRICSIPSEVIALFCSIIKEDSFNIKKYLNKILSDFENIESAPEQNPKLTNEIFYKTLSEYFVLKEKGYDSNTIKTKLSEQCDSKTVDKVFVFLYSLNFERILKMLEKDNAQIVKPDLDKIKSTLKKLYLKNPPSQNIFEQMFNC